ncbi:MAG TPA: hypothetical protein VG675_06010 [Bryobacteraceae bacterium]|nr:hypothetical protein [Bryobacteraceae bacterium]
MKDWRAIAKGNGIEIPAKDLSRIAAVLDALEADFRPSVKDLCPELEPAVIFQADEEVE